MMLFRLCRSEEFIYQNQVTCIPLIVGNEASNSLYNSFHDLLLDATNGPSLKVIFGLNPQTSDGNILLNISSTPENMSEFEAVKFCSLNLAYDQDDHNLNLWVPYILSGKLATKDINQNLRVWILYDAYSPSWKFMICTLQLERVLNSLWITLYFHCSHGPIWTS